MRHAAACITVTIKQRNLRACFGQAFGNGGTDAAACTGNDADPSRKVKPIA